MSEALLRLAVVNAALAALLAVPAALATYFLRRRPAVAHALWLMVLLKLVTPPLLPVPLGWPGEGPTAPPAPVTEELPTCPAAAWMAEPVEPQLSASVTAIVPDPTPEEPFDWPALLVALWLAGAALVWAMAWGRLRRLFRVLGAVPSARADLRERIGELCRRLGLRQRPEVWLVPGVVPPLLVALWPPRLLVPSSLWERLDDAARDTLLLHELAHLRRGDGLVRWLELLTVGLFWWYPLAWWASRSLRDAEELCCDAWVVWAAPESAGAYADALVETVAFLSGSPARVPPLASGAAPVRFLQRRLAMILRRPVPRRLSAGAFVVLALAGAVLLPLGLIEAQSPPAGRPLPVEEAIMRSPSCVACHEGAWAGQGPKPAGAALKESHDKLMKMHGDLTKLMTRLREQRAAVETTEKDLRQILERIEAGTDSKPTARPSTDRRLDEMEKKLELLLKELKDIKDARPKPAPTPASPKGRVGNMSYLNKRVIRIPIRVAPERRGEVKQLVLYVSKDAGRSWEVAGRSIDSLRLMAFDFQAEQDGEYQFNVATIDRRDRQEPPDIYRVPAAMKVRVDTAKPVVELRAVEHGDWQVIVHWKVTDDNLNLDSLRLECRVAGSETWQPLDIKQMESAMFTFSRPRKVAEVRVRVADLAGNSAEVRTLVLEDPLKAALNLQGR